MRNLILPIIVVSWFGVVFIGCDRSRDASPAALQARADALLQRLDVVSDAVEQGWPVVRLGPDATDLATEAQRAEVDVFVWLWFCSTMEERRQMVDTRRRGPSKLAADMLEWNYHFNDADFLVVLELLDKQITEIEGAAARGDENPWDFSLANEIAVFCKFFDVLYSYFSQDPDYLSKPFPAAEMITRDSPYPEAFFQGSYVLLHLLLLNEFGLTPEERARADALGLIEKEPEPFILSPDAVSSILQKGPAAALTDLEELWMAEEYEALVAIADARLMRNPDDMAAHYIRLAVAAVQFDLPAFREHGEHLVHLMQQVSPLTEAELWRSFFHNFGYVQEDERLAWRLQRGVYFKKEFRDMLEELEREQGELESSSPQAQ